jgi:hypothetical protein
VSQPGYGVSDAGLYTCSMMATTSSGGLSSVVPEYCLWITVSFDESSMYVFPLLSIWLRISFAFEWYANGYTGNEVISRWPKYRDMMNWRVSGPYDCPFEA